MLIVAVCRQKFGKRKITKYVYRKSTKLQLSRHPDYAKIEQVLIVTVVRNSVIEKSQNMNTENLLNYNQVGIRIKDFHFDIRNLDM